MKADQSQSTSTSAHSDTANATEEEWTASDPLWKLLNEASSPQENVFFARNVVRTARQLEKEPPSLLARFLSACTAPRLTFGAIACAVTFTAWQLIPSPSTPQTAEKATQDITTSPDTITPVDNFTEETELSELVMLETLSAVAEDPSIFTRDEVVTMIGL